MTDFALETGWQVRYLALEPSALYDVALEKPATPVAPDSDVP